MHGVHVSFQIRVFVFSGHMLKNVVVGSHGSSTFGFLRNLHTGFHSGHTDLRSHQQCGRVWPVPLMLAPHGLALRDALSSGTLI